MRLQSMKYKLIAALCLFMLGCVQLAHANNIQVTSVRLAGQNTSAGANDAANFNLVQFTVSWENSWRITSGPANWDAAWVFVKFRVGASNPRFSNVSLTNASATLTLSSVVNLRVGMPVRIVSGGSTLPAGTVIAAINTSTNQVTLSNSASITAADNILEFIRIWEHATLHNSGHTAPTGSTLDVAADGTGAFIYRSSAGAGSVSYSDAQLRWNYGANAVRDDAVINVQVFAIEMVYVPGGVEFNVGGGGGSSAFTSTTINTGNATTLPSGVGSLGGQAGGYPTGQTAPANANWPNGYNAFYCMKYEISQGQYRDFLNTLSYAQQDIRTATTASSAAGTGALANPNESRNGIDIETPGNATTLQPAVYACNLNSATPMNQADDGEWVACNLISWMDGCAYMDWAGLRPMTELEFEKACRGNQSAVSGEYAWGTSGVATAAYTINNSRTTNEGIATNYNGTLGNANYITTSSSIDGPLRVGIFAANAGNTGRATSGATYYGILEMSGNNRERTVTIGNTQGRSFTGLNGDGMLSSSGNANTVNWPGMVSDQVTGATGSGFRGGGWSSAVGEMRVSDRTSAAVTDDIRDTGRGFRGVRSW